MINVNLECVALVGNELLGGYQCGHNLVSVQTIIFLNVLVCSKFIVFDDFFPFMDEENNM